MFYAVIVLDSEPEDDEFIHLDADECPSLASAAKILFPYLCRQVKASEGLEAAYESEMLQRISEVSANRICTSNCR